MIRFASFLAIAFFYFLFFFVLIPRPMSIFNRLPVVVYYYFSSDAIFRVFFCCCLLLLSFNRCFTFFALLLVIYSVSGAWSKRFTIFQFRQCFFSRITESMWMYVFFYVIHFLFLLFSLWFCWEIQKWFENGLRALKIYFVVCWKQFHGEIFIVVIFFISAQKKKIFVFFFSPENVFDLKWIKRGWKWRRLKMLKEKTNFSVEIRTNALNTIRFRTSTE